MGTNVKTLSPANLAILSNPAVIALNQDPSASSCERIWKRSCSDVDQYGICNTQLWVRTLQSGDIAVALINNGNDTMTLTASLDDILIPERFAGTSTPPAQLQYTWTVHDLWGWRMNNTEAGSIINGTAPMITNDTTSNTRYNSTLMSYADGLNANVSALLGKPVGTLAPQGTLTASVPQHSIALYRLRAQDPTSTARSEL